MKPTVSVIIPTYNRKEELRELLLALTLQTRQDFEVILYNDAGDDVSAVVRECPGLSITLINATTNSGHVRARNVALGSAQGLYVMPIDDDDLILPTHIESLVKVMDEADLAYTDAEVVVWRKTGYGRVPLGRHPFAFEFNRNLLREWNTIIPSGILYRRELHEVLGLFDEEVADYWDWDFILRVTSTHAVIRVASASVLYAIDEDGGNASANPAAMGGNLVKLCEKHGLGELPSSNFLLMTVDERLHSFRRMTSIVWDGKPIR